MNVTPEQAAAKRREKARRDLLAETREDRLLTYRDGTREGRMSRRFENEEGTAAHGRDLDRLTAPLEPIRHAVDQLAAEWDELGYLNADTRRALRAIRQGIEDLAALAERRTGNIRHIA